MWKGVYSQFKNTLHKHLFPPLFCGGGSGGVDRVEVVSHGCGEKPTVTPDWTQGLASPNLPWPVGGHGPTGSSRFSGQGRRWPGQLTHTCLDSTIMSIYDGEA